MFPTRLSQSLLKSLQMGLCSHHFFKVFLSRSSAELVISFQCSSYLIYQAFYTAELYFFVDFPGPHILGFPSTLWSLVPQGLIFDWTCFKVYACFMVITSSFMVLIPTYLPAYLPTYLSSIHPRSLLNSKFTLSLLTKISPCKYLTGN